MCNCNQKRASLKQSPDRHYKNMVKIRLKNSGAIVINGSITGRSYIFKEKDDINWVDRRDLNDFRLYKNLVIVM